MNVKSERYMNRIAELLGLHGIDISPSCSKEELASAVRRFQKESGNVVDGIIGRNTLWSLQYPFVDREKLEKEKVDADLANLEKWGEGYDYFYLREDAACAYKDLYKEVQQKGGCITSSGALRYPDAKVTLGRSSTSLHYLGLALDLSVSSGFQNPDQDVYLVTDAEVDGRHFNVWAKTDDSSCEEVRLDAYVWKNGRPAKREFVGKAFNLTEIMITHGFYPIPPRKGYHDNPPKYICSEWWHFQYEDALIDGVSQFGIELLRIHPERKLEKCDLWRNRKALYSKGAFRSLGKRII